MKIQIQIFTIKDKTESGLNTLVNNFIKNNNVVQVIYKEDYMVLKYDEDDNSS